MHSMTYLPPHRQFAGELVAEIVVGEQRLVNFVAAVAVVIVVDRAATAASTNVLRRIIFYVKASK